jgi:hypothetical protein
MLEVIAGALPSDARSLTCNRFDQLHEIAKEKFIFRRTNEAVSVDFGYPLA